MTKVSIIIPVYNAQDFILGCLQSVASQTMTNGVECILVDDCGSDESIEIASQYISNYSGEATFTLLHQEKNMGPSAARNAGTRIARGEYIFFLDSDDKITPDCIEQLYNLATKYKADYVQGTYESNEAYKMPKYGPEMPEFTDDRKFIKRTLLNYTVIPFTPHNRLVRRQMILDHDLLFNEKITVREDFYWMFFMAKQVESMAVCKQEMYYRGYNADSLTHSINREREIQAYRTLVEDFSKNIDPFLEGRQKTLILDTLIMTINHGFYHNQEEMGQLLHTFMGCCTLTENLLLRLYLILHCEPIRTMTLHLLKRIYIILD